MSKQHYPITWGDSFAVIVVALSLYVFLIFNGVRGPYVPPPLFGNVLVLFFFVAFVFVGIALWSACRRKARSTPRITWLSAVLVLALAMHPVLQLLVVPFGSWYVERLHGRAEELHLVGASEAELIAALGKPAEVKGFASPQENTSPDTHQLRYRHFWPMWLYDSELGVDIENGRVTRIFVKR